MVVAARRQTAAFIQEIESSGFLPKAAAPKFRRALRHKIYFYPSPATS
jgi:hypothetical protein